MAERVKALLFRDDGSIPNNPGLPLLLYPGALGPAAGDLAAVAEELFARNGWRGAWRNGVFPFPHYHSTAHEVLAVCAGEAKVRFGGEAGETVTVRAGDVVVIPAGVGHQNLGSSSDFLIVGAYPAGQEDYDLCRGGAGERPQILENIRRVALPAADPVHGDGGPLLEHWGSAQG
jgi:uncharacterized protein YjlB